MAERPERKSFNERRKLALHEFRQQVIEARSQLSSLFLTMDNGEEYEIPHPMLVSDDAQKRLEIVQSGLDLDKDKEGSVITPWTINKKPADPLSTRTAKALLGDDLHAKFIAAGGHSNDIALAWEMLVEEQKEVSEADPK